jgi:pimeloyl-ACP methyl ester carboxylesterase
MPHLTVNGANLWYESFGEGEPLLLHHGYTATRENWLPVAELLKSSYQIVVMECRGCGDSEHTESGYNLEQYALDAIALMAALGHEKFSYAGHSMGGGVGICLAINHPEKLNKLILMASVGSKGLIGDSFRENVANRLEARKNNDREFFLREQANGRFRDDVQTDDWFELRIDHLMKVSEGHLIDSMKSMQSMDYVEQMSGIKTPTLVLAGGVDPLLKTNIEDYFRLPDASLHVFARAAHEVGRHETQGVADAIDRFMRFGALNSDTLRARADNAK